MPTTRPCQYCGSGLIPLPGAHATKHACPVCDRFNLQPMPDVAPPASLQPPLQPPPRPKKDGA